jgi:hypothetical protein
LVVVEDVQVVPRDTFAQRRPCYFGESLEPVTESMVAGAVEGNKEFVPSMIQLGAVVAGFPAGKGEGEWVLVVLGTIDQSSLCEDNTIVEWRELDFDTVVAEDHVADGVPQLRGQLTERGVLHACCAACWMEYVREVVKVVDCADGKEEVKEVEWNAGMSDEGEVD